MLIMMNLTLKVQMITNDNLISLLHACTTQSSCLLL